MRFHCSISGSFKDGARLKEDIMDIGKSFSYVFDDKDWLKKVAIGGLLNIVPIVNLIPGGYAVRTLKNVSEGKDKPLPEWDDWGGDFMKGLMVTLASLIYAIPMFILGGLSAAVSAIGSASSTSDAEAIAGVCAVGLSCLYALWGLVMGVILPAATVKYAKSGEFASFFRFSEIYRFISTNLGDYIIALLLSIVAFLVASIAGSILCGIGLLFTMFWVTLVGAHLLGQVEPQPASSSTTGGTSYGDLTLGDLSAPKEDKPSSEA